MEPHIKVTIAVNFIEESEILMAKLSEGGYYAFDNDNVHGDEDEKVLNAYISSQDFDEEILRQALRSHQQYTLNTIPDKNWNEQWEKEFQPVIVNSFAGIRASFHRPLENVLHEIIITPKMSFGTGHHATTYMMVEQMEKIDFLNKTVIDFGTGTAILAILAEKSGASKVFAVDNDDWCITNSIENIRNNKCNRITVIKDDSVTAQNPADIILANINLNTLLKNAESISLIASRGALLLVSGFLAGDGKSIQQAFASVGFQQQAMIERENWLSIRLIKN